MENSKLKNKDQDSLQAKELQKFFNKIEGVMIVSKPDNAALKEFALLCLVLDKETYVNFRDYGINKIVVDLLDNKYPILHVKVPEKMGDIGLSIIDKNSGLKFNLPDQKLNEPLVKFLETAKPFDKIAMMLGYFNGDTLTFDKSIKDNILLVLDGYFLE